MRTTGRLLLALVVAGTARADVTVPVTGRPSPFYGAAGKGVTAEAVADPVELSPGQTTVLILRLRNLANPADVQRPELSEIEEFARDFQVEDGPAPDAEPAGTRVFCYRLRPRRTSVTTIPAVTIPFYDPTLPQPPDKPDFPFRKTRTDPIPIRVRKAVALPQPVVPLDVPEFAAEPATTASIDVPAWAWWSAAAAPPVVAVGWCAVWRFLNPGGARLARRRRSRAARTALKTLHALARRPPADPAAVVWCMASYLAERFDLPGVFRTPDDLTRRLAEAGADHRTVAECRVFLEAADAARFAPAPEQSGDALVADAERLVRRLEGEP